MTQADVVPLAVGFCPPLREPGPGRPHPKLRLTRPGLHLGRGGGGLRAGQVVPRSVSEGAHAMDSASATSPTATASATATRT
jgi:hypothetical protein